MFSSPHSYKNEKKKPSKETFSITSQHPLRKNHHPYWNKVDKWPLNRLYRLDVLSLDCIPFMKWCSVCRPLLCLTDTDMKEFFFPFFPASLSLVSLSPVLASNRLEAKHISAYPSAHLTTDHSSSSTHCLLSACRCTWDDQKKDVCDKWSIVLCEYDGFSIVAVRWTTSEGIY